MMGLERALVVGQVERREFHRPVRMLSFVHVPPSPIYEENIKRPGDGSRIAFFPRPDNLNYALY